MMFLSALRRRGQIISALLRREEERRRRQPIGTFIGLFEPLTFIGVLSLLWYLMGTHSRPPLGTSTLLYYSTGFLPFFYFIYIANRAIRAGPAYARRFPVEQRLDYYLVDILIGVFDYVLMSIIYFGALYYWGIMPAKPADVAPLLESAIALTAIGFGWGVFQQAMRQRSRIFVFVGPALARSMVLFSGLFFLPDTLTPHVRYGLSFNPLLQAIELFRTGFYPTYAPSTLDKQYLFFCAIFCVFVGLATERATRRDEGQPIRR